MEELSKNPYVLSVSPKGITYTDAFKEIFMVAYKQGKLPREIFKAHGFRVEVLGMKKIHASQNWWSVSYKKDGLLGLQDWRKDRPEAIEDAKINAEVNKVENEECILGKSEEVIAKLIEECIHADVVVADPSRK